jgi:hypothetical protein
MDKFSYQLHIIPDRISQLAVSRYEIKIYETFLQVYNLLKFSDLLKNISFLSNQFIFNSLNLYLIIKQTH